MKSQIADLPYPQWFALLAMKHFGPETQNNIIRRQTLQALSRRGWCACHADGRTYALTRPGRELIAALIDEATKGAE